MTEQIGWRRARDMTHEAKTAELCSRLRSKWNTRAALKAQPEPAQEPVAWMVYTEDGKSVCVTDNPADFAGEHRALPLYTAPPQRPSLTDEEIDALPWNGSPRQFARAVERKVRGEK
jgi:hypothetical protein